MAGIFKRVEKKYLLSAEQYAQLWERIGDRLAADEYGDYTICNIYFDTVRDDLIRRSLDKPRYKEKLRLRSYGVPSEEDTVYLEMKKKWKGVVYKRRVEMPCRVAEGYIYDGVYPKAYDCQILREIDHMMAFYDLQPRLYLAYDRKAYVLRDDPQIRLTIDRHIRSRREDLQLGSGDAGDALLKKGQRLMEIKVPLALPLWFAETLAELRIFPASFSKYGRVFQGELALAGAGEDAAEEDSREAAGDTVEGEKICLPVI